jgi:hypothetical protein
MLNEVHHLDWNNQPPERVYGKWLLAQSYSLVQKLLGSIILLLQDEMQVAQAVYESEEHHTEHSPQRSTKFHNLSTPLENPQKPYDLEVVAHSPL